MFFFFRKLLGSGAPVAPSYLLIDDTSYLLIDDVGSKLIL